MSTDLSIHTEPRPTSHKWAIFVFAIFAASTIRLYLQGYFGVFAISIIIASLGALTSSLFFKHSTRTYSIAIIALVLIFFRVLQFISIEIAMCIGRSFPVWMLFVIVVRFGIAYLLFRLLRAYTFGADSRRFYGLPSTPKTRSA